MRLRPYQVVAGVQSIFRNPELLGPRHLVIVDEAHLIPRSSEGMYRRALDRVRALVLLNGGRAL